MCVCSECGISVSSCIANRNTFICSFFFGERVNFVCSFQVRMYNVDYIFIRIGIPVALSYKMLLLLLFIVVVYYYTPLLHMSSFDS